jgi:biotin transport system ATP-binding protein
LAICAILVTEPKLIVADEPTALLDLVNSRRIAQALLGELPQQIVLVTHDLELAAGCEVVLRFADGKLVQIGQPAEVIAAYQAENCQV